MTPHEFMARHQHVFVLGAIPPKSTAQKAVRFDPRSKRVFHSQKGQEVVADYVSLLKDQAPAEPITGPIELSIMAVWPYRKSDTATKALRDLTEQFWGKRYAVKPDASNFAKSLEDVLVKLCFIGDDAQVSDLHVYKRFSHTPAVLIGVNSLEEYV